jgi:hypothetical protein
MQIPNNNSLKNEIITEHWWLMPIILATWEAEIQRITVLGQPEAKKKKNLGDPHLHLKKLDMVATLVISGTVGSLNRRMVSQAILCKN